VGFPSSKLAPGKQEERGCTIDLWLLHFYLSRCAEETLDERARGWESGAVRVATHQDRPAILDFRPRGDMELAVFTTV